MRYLLLPLVILVILVHAFAPVLTTALSGFGAL